MAMLTRIAAAVNVTMTSDQAVRSPFQRLLDPLGKARFEKAFLHSLVLLFRSPYSVLCLVLPHAYTYTALNRENEEDR